MSWADYFKKPKEKEPVRNAFGLSEYLEEDFTYTPTAKNYKGVWTDYFKGRLKEKEPVRTVQEIEEMLEVSYTHTAEAKNYKGVWTDYFKVLKEKDPQLPDGFQTTYEELKPASHRGWQSETIASRLPMRN